MFNFFKKKKEVEKPLVTFDIQKGVSPELQLNDTEGFLDFLRNHKESALDLTEHSDQELAHLFIYQYTQKWLVENLKKPLFVETHILQEHGQIRYDRAWNIPFIEAVQSMGFDVLPSTQEEIADVYMNYVYGIRLMEELEALEDADPASIAHPELSDPKNSFKG